MDDIRKRILIIIGTSLIAVSLIVFLIIFLTREKAPIQQTQEGVQNNTQQETSQTTENSNVVESQEVIPPQNAEDVYAKQAAKIFVERYETRSNQNNNMHITDVLSLVTDSMADWLNEQKIEQSLVYEGQDTVVLASSVTKLTDSRANVSIEANQTKQTQDGTTTEMRSGRVELVKVGGVWKVDGFYWD